MKKLILSCSGGGIRGLVQAQFLYRLERDLDRPIHEYFDMYAGTSIGSIHVSMLSVLNVSAKEILDLYTDDTAEFLMPKGFWDKLLNIAQLKPKYNGKGKRNLLYYYFTDRPISSATKKLLIPAYDVEKHAPVIFKSTNSHLPVYEIINASSAAMGFYPIVRTKDNRWFMDGGICVNDPAMVAAVEGIKDYGLGNFKVLSLGTGQTSKGVDGEKASKWGGIQWLSKGGITMMLDEDIVEYHSDVLLKDDYMRINGSLYEADTAMDNTSQDNLKALRYAADMWYEAFGPQVIDFISESS